MRNKGVKKAKVVINHQRKDGTLGVLIESSVKHDKYKGIYQKRSRVLLINFDVNNYSKDEIANDEFLLDRFVKIRACAPKSKHKRFELLEVI